MNVKVKYAKMMYNYLLETLLEQKQHELYLYTLVALHTGLRSSDLIELTWEQFKGDRFTNVKLHKESNMFEREVREDIAIRDLELFSKWLGEVKLHSTGKIFNFKTKYAITPLLRKYTGINMIMSHELGIMCSILYMDEYGLIKGEKYD